MTMSLPYMASKGMINGGTLQPSETNQHKNYFAITTPGTRAIAPVIAAPLVATVGIVVAAPVISSAATAAATTVVGIAATVASGASQAVSAVGNAIEGFVKAITNAPPDTPYLISNPTYQVCSDAANLATTKWLDEK